MWKRFPENLCGLCGESFHKNRADFDQLTVPKIDATHMNGRREFQEEEPITDESFTRNVPFATTR